MSACVCLLSLVFFSTELILPSTRSYNIVTFKNCKWLGNCHRPPHQGCCALSKHCQQALKQLGAKHLPVFRIPQMFLSVMKMQCPCVCQHCLGSSSPPACKQRKLHMNVSVWRLDCPEHTRKSQHNPCKGNIGDEHTHKDKGKAMSRNFWTPTFSTGGGGLADFFRWHTWKWTNTGIVSLGPPQLQYPYFSPVSSIVAFRKLLMSHVTHYLPAPLLLSQCCKSILPAERCTSFVKSPLPMTDRKISLFWSGIFGGVARFRLRNDLLSKDACHVPYVWKNKIKNATCCFCGNSALKVKKKNTSSY